MVSAYNNDGTMKPYRQHQAEVWAHDLSLNRIRLMLEMSKGVKSTVSTQERKALLKEFEKRAGVPYSKATKKQKQWKPE